MKQVWLPLNAIVNLSKYFILSKYLAYRLTLTPVRQCANKYCTHSRTHMSILRTFDLCLKRIYSTYLRALLPALSARFDAAKGQADSNVTSCVPSPPPPTEPTISVFERV